MITRLRGGGGPRPSLFKQKERKGLAWGRWIYISLLSLFVIALANYFVGPSFLLRADGLILQKQYTVAPSYEATVAKIYVQQGERVAQGAPLVQLESPLLSRTLADLATRHAELTSRKALVQSKLYMAQTMLPFATRQHDDMQSGLNSVQNLRQRQLANGRRIEEALTASYQAREKMVELQAQEVALKLELQIVEQAHGEAAAAYAHLKRIYNGGLMVASVEGTVGPTVASAGDGLPSGGKVMEIFAGEPFVLAYLSDLYLFGVEPGQSVLVSTGTRSSAAVVEAVLPIAVSLPPEFQNTFRPRDRSQLVRIRLPVEHGFAIHQKVRVSQCHFTDCRSAFAAFTRLFKLALGASVRTTSPDPAPRARTTAG